MLHPHHEPSSSDTPLRPPEDTFESLTSEVTDTTASPSDDITLTICTAIISSVIFALGALSFAGLYIVALIPYLFMWISPAYKRGYKLLVASDNRYKRPVQFWHRLTHFYGGYVYSSILIAWMVSIIHDSYSSKVGSELFLVVFFSHFVL